MSCCSSGNCGVCKFVRVIVAIVLTLAAIASFLGVWRTHFATGALVYGTPDGSLALLVFVITLHLWHKVVKRLCPCGNKSCGSCSKCGDIPCSCGK